MQDVTNLKEIQTANGKYTVGFDLVEGYGYFVHNSIGEGGDLYFERDEDGTYLSDYDGDGDCRLPMSVIRALRHEGITVDADFE